MIRYIIISVVSGILYLLLDMAINANPLAKKYYEVYKPIVKTAINPLAGVLIDLAYGFILAGVFILLYNSLPGATGLLKGLSYAGLAWFFRVVMRAASDWMMFTIPVRTLIYSLVTGLGEMLILGILFGLALKPPL